MKNNIGRPKGRSNNLTKDLKVELAANIKPEIKNLRKHIVSGVPYELRAKYLLGFAKLILPKGEPLPEEGVQIRQIIYEQLKPEFKKIISYNKRNPPEAESKIMIQLFKLLTPQQQRNILS
jgi:hypothetical protein